MPARDGHPVPVTGGNGHQPIGAVCPSTPVGAGMKRHQRLALQLWDFRNIRTGKGRLRLRRRGAC